MTPPEAPPSEVVERPPAAMAEVTAVATALAPADVLVAGIASGADLDDSAPSVGEPEYESIEAFAEYLADDDRTTYRPADIIRLMRRTKLTRDEISTALAAYGYQPRAR